MSMTEYRKVANEFNAEVRRREAEKKAAKRAARLSKLSGKKFFAAIKNGEYPVVLLEDVAKLPLCKRGHRVGGLNESVRDSGTRICKICQYFLCGTKKLPEGLEQYLNGQPYEPREKKAGNG